MPDRIGRGAGDQGARGLWLGHGEWPNEDMTNCNGRNCTSPVREQQPRLAPPSRRRLYRSLRSQSMCPSVPPVCACEVYTCSLLTRARAPGVRWRYCSAIRRTSGEARGGARGGARGQNKRLQWVYSYGRTALTRSSYIGLVRRAIPHLARPLFAALE